MQEDRHPDPAPFDDSLEEDLHTLIDAIALASPKGRTREAQRVRKRKKFSDLLSMSAPWVIVSDLGSQLERSEGPFARVDTKKLEYPYSAVYWLALATLAAKEAENTENRQDRSFLVRRGLAAIINHGRAKAVEKGREGRIAALERSRPSREDKASLAIEAVERSRKVRDEFGSWSKARVARRVLNQLKKYSPRRAAIPDNWTTKALILFLKRRGLELE